MEYVEDAEQTTSYRRWVIEQIHAVELACAPYQDLITTLGLCATGLSAIIIHRKVDEKEEEIRELQLWTLLSFKIITVL